MTTTLKRRRVMAAVSASPGRALVLLVTIAALLLRGAAPHAFEQG